LFINCHGGNAALGIKVAQEHKSILQINLVIQERLRIKLLQFLTQEDIRPAQPHNGFPLGNGQFFVAGHEVGFAEPIAGPVIERHKV
jgi:hypothetical protein